MKKHPYQGIFVMTDGPDGAGKGVVLDAIKAREINSGKKVFDVQEFSEYYGYYPSVEDVDEDEEHEVVITHEPGYCGVGLYIREELIDKNDRDYSVPAIAEAYSLDRALLYQRTVLPCLEAGKTVVQSRSISTSLAYQPAMKSIDTKMFNNDNDFMTFSDILNLRGNSFVKNYLPDLFLVTLVQDEKVLEARWKERSKDDNAIFENLEFQRKLIEIYSSGDINWYFKTGGCEIALIDTSLTIEDTKKQVWEAYLKLLRDRDSE